MKNLLKSLFLFVALFAFTQGVWAETFITDVMIISGNQSQTDGYKTQYQNEGWTVIDNDLNAGAGGNFIYLLYKTNESSGSSDTAVTGFYLKTGNDDHPNTITHDGHTYSLVPAVGAYDLNCGAGGAYIFLYYTKEAFSPGRMVTDIFFNNNSNGALGANGNTSSGFDLNSGAGGDYIYMHVVTITTDGIIDVYTETQLRDAVMLNDANIRLMADIDIASEVEINNNRTVTLDLNGHTLDRGLSSATNYGHALKVISGSTLTINDASGDNSGIIKGAYTGQGGGIRNYGTIIINGGTIRDNHSGTKGGGINNHNGASLTINGGVITNNEAEDGAGIYNEATGTITINNGSITGNTTNRYGGGGITNYGTLALYGGTVSNNTAIQDGGGIWTDNSLTVSGATIEGNSARDGGGICINHGTADLTNVTISGNTSKDGGGIYVYSVGTLTFNSGSISDNTTTEYGGGGIANHGNTTIIGGFITGNTAMENGGGIWSGKTLTIKGGTITGNRTGNGRLGDGVHFYGGTFNLEGNPQIYGNLKTNGQPGTNVFLPSGKKITVSGAFMEGADVNIAMENHGVFTTGFTSHNTASPVAIFTPDNATFYVTLDGEEARLNIDLSVVSYVDRAWDSVNRVVTAQVKTCTNFTKLEGSNSNSCTELGDGWYVVYKNVSYKKCLKMVGDVHLILVDGATLNVKDGIYIKKDNTFTVYAQEAGLGKIYAHPGSGPGIGGMKNKTAGHFVVKGGIIDARAGSNRNAGIGGGYDHSGIQSVTIYSGNVKAVGEDDGAGIGKGKYNNVHEVVTIYDGDVYAEGGDYGAGIGGGLERGNGEVIIWGGNVKAKGYSGAGIGGGCGGDQDNPITIHGGTVYAKGGAGAAGIGGGDSYAYAHCDFFPLQGGLAGTITINGGNVTAIGGYLHGAGIGNGGAPESRTRGRITINGGFVQAYTDDYRDCTSSAIEAGDDWGYIHINGGEVVAISYGYGAGIGSHNKPRIRIDGGDVTAMSVYGAGIGSYGSTHDEVGGDGGSIYINGGNIFAMSAGKGAGIGGGNCRHGGEIHINGGNVNAIGGYCEYSYFADHGPTFINLGYDVNPAYSMAATALMTFFEEWLHSGTFGGAGIGGGDHGSGATVNITGGTVKAQGGMNSCRAIGKGNGGRNNGSLSIYNKARVYVGAGNDSVVQWKGDRITACQGNKAVAVTHCIHDSLTYAIFDGEKHVEQCFHCDHIALKFHVFDDQGRCTLCGYGKPTYTVTVYMPAESCDGTYESVTYTVGQGKDFQLPESISRIGALQFVGWMLGTPADVQGYEWIDYEPLCAENGIYSNVTSDLSFIARYAEYWDGTGMGTIGDPYLVATTADLDQLATRVNEGQDFLDKYFLLVEDLAYDGTANNYTSIGGTRLYNRYASFNGTFDGDGHSISGINIQSGIFRGVFGYLGANGNITRLTVSDCTFKGSAYIGSIVGSNEGTVDHCLVLGGTVQGSTSCGHVIGYNIKKTLFNYYTANDNLGGIGGSNSASTVVNLFGGDKGYTIHCAEGLSLEYVNGSAAGSYDDALIVHDGTLYAAAGVTISFKVSPAMGFGIESLMCNGTEITPNSHGVYTFTMPAADVSITSILLQTTFITEGNWHDEANWSNGLPSEGSDVVIAAPATIHGSVNVGYVTFENGGSITIADGGQLIHAGNVRATLQKEIIGYDEDNDGWYTIASPSTSPVSTANLITESEYDLYLYHEPTHYWWNSEDSLHNFNTLRDLEGYLYANEEKVTLSLTGNMQATDNTVTIPLSYNNSAGRLKGFNLVGNPFTRGLTQGDLITIGDDALTTYLLADGDGELVSYALAERPIEPGEGFFVQATEPGQNLVINSATRGEQAKGQPAYFRIEVGNEGYYDHAYVQFGGGNTLRKMKLSDNIPSVSVLHDGEDWAAVTIGSATGELPVNFKATENGTYTISISTEGLEVDYLHLIDNMTGADTDLLQTPSYSFEAKTTDYESRFKLAFAADEAVCGPNEAFAFISNGVIIVDGEGMLQLIDMTGRIIISRDGVHTVSTNGITPGVYVLRLINGDDVKTQKMVLP
jgi:hypothetical protein